MLDNNRLLESSLNFKLISKMLKSVVEKSEDVNLLLKLKELKLKDKYKTSKQYEEYCKNSYLNLNSDKKFFKEYITLYIFEKLGLYVSDLEIKNNLGNISHYGDASYYITLRSKEEVKKSINDDDFEFLNSRRFINVQFSIRELFSNCSTTVFNKINIENYSHFSDSEFLEKKELIYQTITDLVVNLGKMAGYTTMLYSFSDRETNGREVFRNCLEKAGFLKIDEYNNKKRGNNLITIYSKRLA